MLAAGEKVPAHLLMQRQHRLKKSSEFQRVRALKQSWAHPLLVLYAAINDLDATRVGISVSKRLGKAVARNRVKRLIRESVRALLPDLAPGRDLVFVARPAASGADYQQIQAAVERLLSRSRLMREQGPQIGVRAAGTRSEEGATPPRRDGAGYGEESERSR